MHPHTSRCENAKVLRAANGNRKDESCYSGIGLISTRTRGYPHRCRCPRKWTAIVLSAWMWHWERRFTRGTWSQSYGLWPFSSLPSSVKNILNSVFFFFAQQFLVLLVWVFLCCFFNHRLIKTVLYRCSVSSWLGFTVWRCSYDFLFATVFFVVI